MPSEDGSMPWVASASAARGTQSLDENIQIEADSQIVRPHKGRSSKKKSGDDKVLLALEKLTEKIEDIDV